MQQVLPTDDANAGKRPVRGRFAPSPTGRMHLGNVATALVSWLSVKSQGGKWVLRIEDLDPQRSRLDYARQIEDDLHWLGLDWDEGGVDGHGSCGPYMQSLCTSLYSEALETLRATGLTYPCFCSRADIMATQAPHQSDGRVVYQGTCRPMSLGGTFGGSDRCGLPKATRLYVPDRQIAFTDRLYGTRTVNLARHCGDFVLQRSDKAWAYQLAVVVDDARMGITEVVRGNDLLLSSAQQLYLYELLGLEPPEFAHIPLVCNSKGVRLSKRDRDVGLEALRRNRSPEQVVGSVAHALGLLPYHDAIAAADLLPVFSWSKIEPVPTVVIPCR